MAVDSLGPKGQPHFDNTLGFDLGADQAAISDFAAYVGNRVAGAAAVRVVQTSPNVWEGLEWFETDTGKTYLYTGSAWHLQNTQDVGFTPAFTSGVTVGNGSSYGVYKISNGSLVDIAFDFLLGSTSAITGQVGLQIPGSLVLNTITGAFRYPVGQAVFYDTSGGSEIYGEITIASSTSVALRPRNVAGSYQTVVNLASGVPFTWAPGDQISGRIRAFLA